MTKKLLLTAFFFLAIFSPQVTKAYEFWAVSSSGDTLYYNTMEITGGKSYVWVTYPSQWTYDEELGDYDGWKGHLRPSGNVTIPSTVYKGSTLCYVKGIDQYAFSYCRDITSITIPSSVKEIYSCAFVGCSGILTLNVPSTVSTISASAFTSIPNVVYNGSASGSPWGAQIVNGYVNGNYVYSNSTKTNLVAVKKNITTADNIPNTVTSIANKAFSGCYNLTSVTIPSGVSTLGEMTFSRCTSLDTFVVPDNITSIGDFCFEDCSNLSHIEFSNNLSSIGHWAFHDCNSLEKVELPVGLHSIGYNAFYNCANLHYLSIPNTIDTVEPQIIDKCANIDTLVIDANSGISSVSFAFMNLEIGQTPSINLIFGPHVTSVGIDKEYNHSTYSWNTYWVFHCLDGYLSSVTIQGNVLPSCANPATTGMVPLNIPCHLFPNIATSTWNCYSNVQSFQSYAAFIQNEVTGGTIASSISCDTLVLTATASYGYEFSHWSDVNDESCNRTVILTKDTTITGFFSKLNYSVTANSNSTELGQVLVSGGVAYLDTAIITAIPAPHCHFVKWAGEESITDNPDSIIVSRDTNITAIFAPDTFVVSAIAGNPSFGTVTGDGQYTYGTVAEIKATANDGYIFSHWGDYSTSNPREVIVINDSSFVAFFTEIWRDTVTIHDSTIVPVHDTTYIDVHDTTYVDVPFDVHDTTYINVPYAVHDTTYIDVHDTSFVTDTMTVTKYVLVHDTTIITDTVTVTEYVHVHDTTIRTDTLYFPSYLYDTLYVAVHDTTFVDTLILTEYVPVHDTTIRTDTLYFPSYLYDTLYVAVHDTTFFDTLILTEYVPVHDTTIRTDTLYFPIYLHDTSYVAVHDTTYVNIRDTTYIPIHDTTYLPVYLHDTSYVAIYDTTTLYDTLTVTEYVPVHDTTIRTDTLYLPVYLHDTSYVEVHDTTYVDVHDTTYVPIHDTTYLPVYLHDTSYVAVHDTTNIYDTLIVTEYVPVHDTTIRMDTLYLPVYLYDTSYVAVHDTTYIDMPYPVYDTTYIDVHDTTIINVPMHDTTYITQTDTLTLTQYDTITNTVYDTVTNTLYDTVDNYIYDTVTVTVTDTLWLTQYDTITIYDTIVVHDTIVVGVNDVETIDAKIYTSHGQIVVDGADGNDVWLYDVNGRVLATRKDEQWGTPLRFDAPASGTYMIKIGNHPARKVVLIK